MTGDTVPCVDCGELMPLRRLTEAELDHCIPCGKKRPAEVYFMSSMGFKNNGAEIRTKAQFTAEQEQNHVRG